MVIHDGQVKDETKGLTLSCIRGSHCQHHIDPDEAATILKEGKQMWLHLNYTDRDRAEDFLENKLGFHELAVEDALSPNERPALNEFEGYIFLVVPAIAESKDGEESFVEIGFFLSDTYLVSVADRNCPTVEAWLDRWTKRPAKEDLSPSDLLYVLIDGIVDAYMPLIDNIEDEVDQIADNIFAGDKNRVFDLLKIKRRLLEIRRRMGPLRDVVNGLLRRDIDLIPEHSRPYFQDIYDHTVRVSENVDLQRDTLTSLLDVHLSVVSNNLNEVMKKMTVIATVLMTAALIAGIYGMNFGTMPELHWKYGYPLAIGMMVVSSIGILMAFRWKKWI